MLSIDKILTNKAIVDIRLHLRCAAAPLNIYTSLTQVPLMLN